MTNELNITLVEQVTGATHVVGLVMTGLPKEVRRIEAQSNTFKALDKLMSGQLPSFEGQTLTFFVSPELANGLAGLVCMASLSYQVRPLEDSPAHQATLDLVNQAALTMAPRDTHTQKSRHHQLRGKSVRMTNDSIDRGLLPEKLAQRYEGHLLVFSDASLRRKGGIASVLFTDANATPVVTSKTVPIANTDVLELEAALLGLHHATQAYPDRPVVLFSDNQGCVSRLAKAKAEGLDKDEELVRIMTEMNLEVELSRTQVQWIKGHNGWRGNKLADHHAGQAACSR